MGAKLSEEGKEEKNSSSQQGRGGNMVGAGQPPLNGEKENVLQLQEKKKLPPSGARSPNPRKKKRDDR